MVLTVKRRRVEQKAEGKTVFMIKLNGMNINLGEKK